MKDIRKKLIDFNITLDPKKDQFVLENEKITEKMVSFANLNKHKDIVLEIGAGPGNITLEIAKHAKKVLAYEIDKQFEPLLKQMPTSVDVHIENARKIYNLNGKFYKTKEFNKIISGLPYSLCEPLLHNLTFLLYDKVILLVPKKFVGTIKTNPVFCSFFDPKELLLVKKEKFYPIPKSDSIIIDLVKKTDPIKSKNLGLFLRQYIYQHEEQIVKNSLREGLIIWSKKINRKILTKNEAREIINSKEISIELLNDQPNGPEIYGAISKAF